MKGAPVRAGLILALAMCAIPAGALADGINGFLEYGYNTTNVTTESAGIRTRLSTDSFLQRYNLAVDRSFFPLLKFTGGALFERNASNLSTDGTDIDTTTTRFVPRGELLLGGTAYNAGVGYVRREEKTQTTGTASVTNVSENYNAKLGLRPEGLPTVDLIYMRTNFFDKERAFQDSRNESYLLTSRYREIKNLDMSYLAQYTISQDNLTGLETTLLTNNGRVAYGRQFLDNRISVFADYNVVHQQSETVTATGAGTVLTRPPIPPAGLFAVDTNPLLITLTREPLLTDGNPTVPAAQQDRFRIGAFTPQTADTTKSFHFGLDLGSATSVNTIFVTINQNLDQSISSQFTWRVFFSDDVSDEPTNWTEVSGAVTSLFRPFGTGETLDNSFEISFPATSHRHFKVVVTPRQFGVRISPSVDDRIFVAELQAFLRQPVSELTGRTTTSLSHLLDFNGKARLLDIPEVNYELNITYAQNKTGFFSSSRYNFSNGISARHRFNRVFSGTGRFVREDSNEPLGDRVAYFYSASLLAAPFPTLSHTLVYSGKNEVIGANTASSNSIYLTNLASIYRGVDLNLSGGYSSNDTEGGLSSDTLSMTFGASFVPNPKLNLNLSYSGNNTQLSGPGVTTPHTFTQRADLTAAFNPFRSLYLFGNWSVITETRRQTRTTQSYGGSWGILRDGALQLNFSYNETLNSVSRQKDRTIVPNLRWNIRPGSFLEVSYLLAMNESETLKSDSESISATLRITF